jgi:hypothetical protein
VTVTAHEDVLRRNSPFFRAALDKKWQKDAGDILQFPEDQVDVIVAYVDWLYTAKIPNTVRTGHVYADYVFLCNLYVFGEKIQDDLFCNAASSKLLLESDKPHNAAGDRTIPGASSIRVAYNGTPAGSPLRKLLAAQWAETALPEWVKKPEDICPEFFFDMIRYLLETRGPRSRDWYGRRGHFSK